MVDAVSENHSGIGELSQSSPGGVMQILGSNITAAAFMAASTAASMSSLCGGGVEEHGGSGECSALRARNLETETPFWFLLQ